MLPDLTYADAPSGQARGVEGEACVQRNPITKTSLHVYPGLPLDDGRLELCLFALLGIPSDMIHVVAGLDRGKALHRATDAAVAALLGAGELEYLVDAVRRRWPRAEVRCHG